MEITQIAVAGTVESSDILITVEPTEADEIQISLESSVEKQFGQQIKKVIEETIKNLGIKSVRVAAVDKGAFGLYDSSSNHYRDSSGSKKRRI